MVACDTGRTGKRGAYESFGSQNCRSLIPVSHALFHYGADLVSIVRKTLHGTAARRGFESHRLHHYDLYDLSMSVQNCSHRLQRGARSGPEHVPKRLNFFRGMTKRYRIKWCETVEYSTLIWASDEDAAIDLFRDLPMDQIPIEETGHKIMEMYPIKVEED